ncbi:MAG: UDP-N-acetylmuramoyl-tripeptide--D-alanyl-D-alanine ligase [Clostridia bacterium]|nr:UDP-N-acetylmuramoyl-tripeptide--D-alanyl-D-alanine ligase [Clostridia bacterium]
MILNLSQIAEFSGGKLYGNGEIEVKGFFTDSRKAEPGKMFVAIKGENTDGHKYIPNVIEAGCKACFSQVKLPEELNINYVLVDDSVAALQKCATECRKKIKAPIIGITGSVGKTTTKEIVSLALSSALNVNKTEGNANGQIGLPQMIMKTESDHNVCVFEMGMSYPGEMKRLADMAKPNIAIMTNIGVSHIEFHGSRENIMAEKIRIADYIAESGTIFVNGDDDLLCTLKDKHASGEVRPVVVTFGTNPNCDFVATNIRDNGIGTQFTYLMGKKSHEVYLPVLGMHNVRNALAALAVAEYLGLDINKVIEALATYKSPDMRGGIKKVNNITFIDDTYNASPDSMVSSIDVLAGFKGRRIAVLSDMLELGTYSEKGHREVGEAASKKQIDFLVAVGNEAEFIYDGFDCPEKSEYFKTNSEANAFLETFVKSGDTLLIKGSRGMHTEEILNHLCERFA